MRTDPASRRVAAVPVAVIAALALAGCATTARSPAPPAAPPPPPRGVTAAPPATPGNPPFYEVEGRRYFVLGDSAGYVERGVASWYGTDFHGKKTSSGEPYDMRTMTAAHKTLPLPTTARVTNLANGRSIVVRVNDRGPFRKDRLIDLSWAAARDLDMLGPGTAFVEVEALPDTDAAAAAAAPRPAPGRIFVQVGAYADARNAEAMKQRLATQGLHNVVIRYDARRAPALYHVRVGPVADAGEYDAVVQRVATLSAGRPQLVVEAVDPARNVPAGDAQGMPGG
jgi:rare lipoprotein A